MEDIVCIEIFQYEGKRKYILNNILIKAFKLMK